jgi:hypothetical protein
MTKEVRKVQITGSGSNQTNGNNYVTIGYLLPEEQDALAAMTLGASWCRIKDGRVEQRATYEELPPPENDPYIPPSWYATMELPRRWLVMPVPSIDDEPNPEHHSPSIIVQHLCGYNNTPYKVEALKLQAFGFECLRSRRGPEGKFWEMWYLPYLDAAKGSLRDAIKSKDKTAAKIIAAVDHLCGHVSFGSLNVSYQRACMVID